MKPPEGINVLQKDGISYVSLPRYGPGILINGSEPMPCPGNSQWAMLEGEVSTIVQVKHPARMILQYLMREKYYDLLALPRELPADPEDHRHCQALDELGDLSQFYYPEYNEPDPIYENMAFIVIDKDCEPVHIPDYVSVGFPGNLQYHPETWHKYPCHIAMEKVFDLVWDRIEKHIKNSNGKYTMKGYKNIQTLSVYEVIRIPTIAQQAREITIPPSGRSRKSITRTVTDTSKEIQVLDLVGSYKHKANSKQIQPVKGKNLDELQAELETYIMSFLGILAPGQRQVCPHCKGHSVVAIKESKA